MALDSDLRTPSHPHLYIGSDNDTHRTTNTNITTRMIHAQRKRSLAHPNGGKISVAHGHNMNKGLT